MGQDRNPDFLLPNPEDDPFVAMADQLKLTVSEYFEFVDGVAFASKRALD